MPSILRLRQRWLFAATSRCSGTRSLRSLKWLALRATVLAAGQSVSCQSLRSKAHYGSTARQENEAREKEEQALPSPTTPPENEFQPAALWCSPSASGSAPSQHTPLLAARKASRAQGAVAGGCPGTLLRRSCKRPKLSAFGPQPSRPNPSVNRTRYGKAARPRGAMVYPAPRGRAALPQRSGYLER